MARRLPLRGVKCSTVAALRQHGITSAFRSLKLAGDSLPVYAFERQHLQDSCRRNFLLVIVTALLLLTQVNDVTNILLGRMSSEEFTAAWLEKRPMRRLEGALLHAVGDKIEVRPCHSSAHCCADPTESVLYAAPPDKA